MAVLLLGPGQLGADALERSGEGFLLGQTRLSAAQAIRPVVLVEGPLPAFRFDGNSNWLQSDGAVTLSTEGLSIGVWIALAAPPADRASILQIGALDLRLSINPWRQPEFRLGSLRIAAFDQLPVGEWVHVSASVADGMMRLQINGVPVAERRADIPPVVNGPMSIGRHPEAGMQEDVHPLGVLNATLAQLVLRQGGGPVLPGPPPDAVPSATAPAQWFAADRDRPRLFPLAAAGWTNEPHSLVWREGLWHLYHQANPNGAYWRSIVWGHLVSDDLVTWAPQFPGLMPSPGFDRRGVWVGGWIDGLDPPAVLYTGVNGAWAGIGIAELDAEGVLKQTSVAALDTPDAYQDMRDPFVLPTDTGWIALIGAGEVNDDKALIYQWASKDGRAWEPTGLFDTGDARMPGEYWELPMLIPVGDRWVLFGTPVEAGVPARTLYWVGSFDGARFRPDDPEPRQYDALATLRAPTIATGPAGEIVAIGIIADELRGEPARHEAGWVHALSPAMEISLCDDDPLRLCHALAPKLTDSFASPLPDVRAEGGWIALGEPALLKLQLEGSMRMDIRAAADGSASAILALNSETGEAILDFTTGPLLPNNRPARVLGQFPIAETAEVVLIFDGAVVAGTVNGVPIGFMVHAGTDAETGLALHPDPGATVRAVSLAIR